VIEKTECTIAEQFGDGVDSNIELDPKVAAARLAGYAQGVREAASSFSDDSSIAQARSAILALLECGSLPASEPRKRPTRDLHCSSD
jgi:hypothetical protein